MRQLSSEIISFFNNQGFTIISSIDEDGSPHNACKGLVKIDATGRVYLLDLYRGKTYTNLKANPHISVTAVDEHRFKGYCLKGKAIMVSKNDLPKDLIAAWEDRITSRLTKRVLKNIHEEKGHPRHPEILLPNPEYMIVIEVEEVVDLTPHHLKKKLNW